MLLKNDNDFTLPKAKRNPLTVGFRNGVLQVVEVVGPLASIRIPVAHVLPGKLHVCLIRITGNKAEQIVGSRSDSPGKKEG